MKERSGDACTPGVPVWAFILAAGVALMTVGARLGDFGMILLNARLICLSCIGIE
ncbi:MAG: hypothetical protein WCZ48_07665 [Bacillota bacterium]|nr:hypothetical protein [Bacillota bacterium]NLH86922.1 hypothetical protein [Bacillota bacterium]